jgi:hypothetical protein
MKGKIISVYYCGVYDILFAYGVVIPVIIAKDTQRRHVQKQAVAGRLSE